ncbi:MAG: hypothetical protein EPN91_06640 [Salinibacterium sp.]|nr:MAG: hypothetical protein EPN91_06640 [Salinibacterium sp.]
MSEAISVEVCRHRLALEQFCDRVLGLVAAYDRAREAGFEREASAAFIAGMRCIALEFVAAVLGRPPCWTHAATLSLAWTNYHRLRRRLVEQLARVPLGTGG